MAGIDVHVVYDQSTILLTQRERLAQQALDMKADYALWLDSDMMFPSTTAMRLLAHNVDIVCSNYMKRSVPLQTVAYPERGNWENWLPLEGDQELQEVEGVGMGCMLMKTEVLNKIQPPYFAFEYKDKEWHGEDFYFQNKLRNAGYKILIDMNISFQVRHIGQWAFGPSLGVNEEQRVKREVKKMETFKKAKVKKNAQ
jgi:hypothetical protein